MSGETIIIIIILLFLLPLSMYRFNFGGFFFHLINRFVSTNSTSVELKGSRTEKENTFSIYHSNEFRVVIALRINHHIGMSKMVQLRREFFMICWLLEQIKSKWIAYQLVFIFKMKSNDQNVDHEFGISKY